MYQNLFEALQNVCGFTALENDMFEIINAYEKDKAEQLPQADVKKSVCGAAIMPYCVDYVNNGYCGRCGKEMKQAVL